MDASDFTDLYDSTWFFGMQTLNTRRRSLSTSDSPPDSPTLAGMYLQLQKQQSPPAMLRSVSEDLLFSKPSFNESGEASPDSVLCTILSGKEFTESAEDLTMISSPPLPPKSQSKATAARRRRAKKESGGPASKSLSSLEFEELKGFMDLGFVFSEKDKDSSLVSILPGLQRLGKNEAEEEAEDSSAVARRPYLSEAWAVQEEEKRKKKIAMTNWRVPTKGNEIDMKDSLKLWAQTVASTVR